MPNRSEGSPRESPGRFPAIVENDRFQQTTVQCQYSVVLEQMRPVAGWLPPLLPDSIILISPRPSWMPACDSINTWFLTATDLMITTRFQTVRSFLRCFRPRFHSDPDFRNKFGALHQSYTPNRERELYSESFALEVRQ